MKREKSADVTEMKEKLVIKKKTREFSTVMIKLNFSKKIRRATNRKSIRKSDYILDSEPWDSEVPDPHNG